MPKIHLHPTSSMVTLDKRQRLRLWEGVTDEGTHVQVLALVTVAAADNEAFAREFGELESCETMPTVAGVELLTELILLAPMPDDPETN